MRAKWSQR